MILNAISMHLFLSFEFCLVKLERNKKTFKLQNNNNRFQCNLRQRGTDRICYLVPNGSIYEGDPMWNRTVPV